MMHKFLMKYCGKCGVDSSMVVGGRPGAIVHPKFLAVVGEYLEPINFNLRKFTGKLKFCSLRIASVGKLQLLPRPLF